MTAIPVDGADGGTEDHRVAATQDPVAGTAEAGPPRRARWLPSFVALSAIWGSSFALIKIAVEAGVAPLWVAFWRCALGALTLLVVCAVTRTGLPRGRRAWGHAAVVSLLHNAVPFTLFAYGEQHVSSVLAGLINATTPLMTLVFVLLLAREERITARRVLGLLIGFAGVLCVLAVWRGIAGGTLAGALAILGATAGYGAGFAYMQRFYSGGGSVAALSAAQLSCATVVLAFVAPVLSGPPVWPGVETACALLLLGALGSGFAYILNLTVLRAAGPTIASTVTYVIPLWSTALGALLLGEHVGWNTVAGGMLVVLGVVVTRTRPGRPRRGRAAR